MLRKFYTIAIVFIISSFVLTESAKASHLMGGNITYLCQGNGKYAINLSLFRDCNGINLGTSAFVNVSSSTCNFNQQVTLQAFGTSFIAPLCPSEPDVCDPNTPFGVGTYGIEEFIYRGTVQLPVGCGNDWVFEWGSCCRNGIITTGAANDGFEVQALLDNTVSPCNNSPAFNNRPTTYFCVNQENYYNQWAADAQGDSLVYSLVNCSEQGGGSVGYNAGLSGANPLTGTITLDPQTGNLLAIPSNIEVGVICVQVEEFRNGIKIGEIVRDIQFSVTSCSGNSLPIASGINGTADSSGTTGSYVTSICAGGTVDFNVVSFDNEIAGNLPGHQITEFKWNNGILGANFVADFSGAYPTANFKWTPDNSAVGKNDFLIIMQDNACPLFGSNVFTYTVDVTANTLENITTTPDLTIDEGDTILILANVNSTATITYSWTPATGLSCTNCQAPQASPDTTTTYTVEVSDANGCYATDQLTITVIADTTSTSPVPTNLQEWKIFPNPSSGVSFVDYTLTGSSEVNIELFDLTGRKVGQVANENQTAGNYRYNLASFVNNNGLYLVRMTIDGQSVTKKLLIQ